MVLSTAKKGKMVCQVQRPFVQSGYSWLQLFPSEKSSVNSFDLFPNTFPWSLAPASIPEEKNVHQIQKAMAENEKQVCLSGSGKRSLLYCTSQGKHVQHS